MWAIYDIDCRVLNTLPVTLGLAILPASLIPQTVSCPTHCITCSDSIFNITSDHPGRMGFPSIVGFLPIFPPIGISSPFECFQFSWVFLPTGETGEARFLPSFPFCFPVKHLCDCICTVLLTETLCNWIGPVMLEEVTAFDNRYFPLENMLFSKSIFHSVF